MSAKHVEIKECKKERLDWGLKIGMACLVYSRRTVRHPIKTLSLSEAKPPAGSR